MKTGAMMDAVINIRESTDADLARITEIYGRSVREETASFEYTEPDQAEIARRRKAIVDAGFPYLVAEIDSRVVGYAYVSAFHPRPGYRSTVENTVYVDADSKRSGVGRALLRQLIAECEKLGFRQMIAVIGGSGHAASIGLHKALGFTDAGKFRSVGYKHGKWLDTIQLQLTLGPGDATPPE